MEMMGIEENGHCCSLSYPSSEGSIGDKFASVFLFPSSVLLDELRDSNTLIISIIMVLLQVSKGD